MAIRITRVDKSTRHQVFKGTFIGSCIITTILPIFGHMSILLSMGNTRYSDERKQKLMYKASLLGLLFLPSLVTIIGLIYLIKYVRKVYSEIKEPQDEMKDSIDYVNYLNTLVKEGTPPAATIGEDGVMYIYNKMELKDGADMSIEAFREYQRKQG